ncbi:YkgJ family cysteine cluster protein [Candidatus Magnetomonas plexicatena]|uniref:YkgJ family cysteine cluster protein n=1 Tax=Candidatus Magnetomonas plexicatena TaxID=2552947 RepID=UPI001C74DC0A|nr:YkgJ family cysteine cluster protein [Nitrospirales bacterium LBB_01]
MQKIGKSEFNRRRVNFESDESRFPWLSMLLDSYAIIDTAIESAIELQYRSKQKGLACQNGCCHCCKTHKDIPVYPHELVGIYFYVTEKIKMPVRETLKWQLQFFKQTDFCPFLISSSCVIHILRPTACRQFNVFGTPCAEGEDPFFTRRDDVLTPNVNHTNQAFLTVLDFYEIKDDKKNFIQNNKIHTHVKNLRELKWLQLIKAMNDYDLKAASL